MKSTKMKLKTLAVFGMMAAMGLTARSEPVKAIDMEHHFYIPEFIDFVKARNEYPIWKPGVGLLYSKSAALLLDRPASAFKLTYIEDVKLVDLITDFDDTRIKYLDYAGISCAAISNTGGIEMLSREDAVKFARMSNDAVAAAIKRHPGRYVGTITLPTPYVDEAIKELERAVKVLGLAFWHTHANYGCQYLYEPQFEPLFAKCAELNVPFYLHPVSPSCDYLTDRGTALASAGFGFGVDTMKTAICLITGGLFDRYPNLKMILGHMGEYFPYCLDRMDNRFGIFNGIDPELKWKHNFTYYFKNMNIFMTTSGIYDPNVVDIAIKNIGIDNIVLGTDYPYEDIKGAVDFVKKLPISQEDKEKILYRNAEKYILSQTAPGALAVWDFDGTILKGDCSEGLRKGSEIVYPGLIADCIRAGFAADYRGDEGVARFWREYAEKIAAGRKREAYEDVARIFAGAEVEKIEAFARKRFAETMKPHLFAYSLKRFQELESAGVENHVVSASPEFFVQAAAETLGVPRSRMHGIQLVVKDGRLVNRIVEPFPYGDGKSAWVRKLEKASGRKAMYGFGNSYGTDGPFLKAIAQQEGTSLMINGGKTVPGMTEFFVCTNLETTCGMGAGR